jgi:putative salt-induced outer membrane protein
MKHGADWAAPSGRRAQGKGKHLAMKSRYLWICAALVASPAAAEPMPPPVKAMIEKALGSGDKAKAAAVAGIAKDMYPESAKEIDGMLITHAKEQEAIKEKKMAEAGFFERWTGEGQIGGSFTTGNSSTTTVAAGLSFKRDGLRWRQNFDALMDLKRNNGVTDEEQYAVNYQVDYKFTKRFYAFAAGGWERNQSAGLRSRFSESVGLGYRVVETPRVTWDIEGGPTLRQAKFFDRNENNLAYRAASKFGWQITPTLKFTQDTSGFIEGGSSSILSATALTAVLYGKLSGRLGFDLQYESHPPLGLKHLDTTTRVTLVYGF